MANVRGDGVLGFLVNHFSLRISLISTTNFYGLSSATVLLDSRVGRAGWDYRKIVAVKALVLFSFPFLFWG